MEHKSCQDCGISWESELSIFETFVQTRLELGNNKEDAHLHAHTDAGFYGATEEGGEKFGANMLMVEYWCDSPNRYDGWSETKCTGCGVRRGRWSQDVLAEGEEERRFGGIEL